NNKTSWDHVSSWFDQIVSKEGHYYHKEGILPYRKDKVTGHLNASDASLDVACGQGILERQIPKELVYLGLDISKNLIREAKNHTLSKSHNFKVQDVTAPFQLDKTFTFAFIVLAFQNLK